MAEQSKPNDYRQSDDAINRLADAIIARQPKQYDPLDLAGISEERKLAMKGLGADGKPIPPKRWRLIACKSLRTGATFTALVVESKTHRGGRVISLHDYRHPRAAYLTESNGGELPDGTQVFEKGHTIDAYAEGKDPHSSALTPQFRQYRWINYFQRDLREVVGEKHGKDGALHPAMCVDPTAFDKAPWQEGAIDIGS